MHIMKDRSGMVVIGMGPNLMLLEAIEAAARKAKMTDGVIVSGIGTLKNANLYAITHTAFPPEHESIRVVRPLELMAINGIIADGKAHIHVVVSCGKDEVWAGHLEPGSEVAYLAELAIMPCRSLKMTRRADARGISLLQPKKAGKRTKDLPPRRRDRRDRNDSRTKSRRHK